MIKKLCIIFTALVLGIVMVFGVAGCNVGSSEFQKKIDDLQSQVAEMEDKLGERDATIEDLKEQIKKQEEEIEQLEKELEEEKMNGKEPVGAFYTVKEAYENGWLTQEDLLSIAYYHNGGRAYNEEIMSETYQPAPKMPEVLSEETELKIKITATKECREKENIKYAEVDGFTITQYYGTYGNCVAVMMIDNYSDFMTVELTDTVAGVNFYYPYVNLIKIWRGIKQADENESVGAFYTLQEAYENGWLTQDDIMSIAYYHNGGRKGNETVMDEDYTPQPKTPEALDDETDLAIKLDFWITNYREYNPHNITLDQIDYAYYGSYGKCIVVKIAHFPYPAGDVYGEVYYGDVKIIYTNSLMLSVWIPTEDDSLQSEEKESTGSFYTLQEAYDNGWLTQDDIMSIAYYHNGGRAYNEEIMSETYQPAPKMPEVLSEETELKIKITVAEGYRQKYKEKDATPEEITIKEYYGTYGDCVAIMAYDIHTDTTGAERMDSPAGVNIYYNNGRTIQIWRETK